LLTKYTHLIDFLLLHTCILKDLFDRFHGLPEEIEIELLKLGAGKRLRKVISVLERLDFETRGLLGGKSTLGLFYFALELAQRTKVGRDVGASFLLVLLDEVFDDAVIKVLTTQVGITSGSQDLEDTIVDREERDIESTTTEVIDDDAGLRLGFFVEAIRDGSGRRFVNDTKDLQPSDDTSVFGRLALSVVEV
jgi:hypothetical protein